MKAESQHIESKDDSREGGDSDGNDDTDDHSRAAMMILMRC